MLEEIKKAFLETKITHNSSLWPHIYTFLRKGLSYNQYKYHFLKEEFIIPKCKYSDNECYFIDSKMEYSKASKDYFIYLKEDEKILCEWLKNEYLFDLGLEIDELKKLKDKLKKIKLLFRGVSLEEKVFIDYLMKDDFTYEKSYEIYNMAKAKDKDLFLDFIEIYYEIKSFRNFDIRYWTERGHSLKDSKNYLESFFKKGSQTVKKKRLISYEYDLWFKKTRKPEAEKSHTISGSNKSSNLEKLIKNELSKKYTLKNYYTPVINSELKQIWNKRNFIHDFYVNDKFIIEYNGGYWHKDFINFNQFTKDDYMFEIKKAHNCLHEVKRGNNPNYIVIWENDFTELQNIISFIDNIISLGESSEFYSSREIDIDFYEEYRKFYLKKEKEISRFRDIVLRMSQESHCQSFKVAAIAVKDGRIIATGINGSPPGFVNCDTYFNAMHTSKNIDIPYSDWIKTKEWREIHHDWSDKNETHAEQSLICEAAKKGIPLNGCDIYVSHQPCMHCSKMLTGIGVKNIYYVNAYDKADSYSKFLLNSSGITLTYIGNKNETEN